MSLFAIADPHLSLDADKSMEVFRGWQDYVARLEANWRAVVGEEDTVVIAGDLSWGMSLAGALRDMQFLHSLPGRKLLLKGNHDYWWSTRRKMDTFFESMGFTRFRSSITMPLWWRELLCAARAAGFLMRKRTPTKK